MKLIDDTLLTRLQREAATQPRGRTNHNLHPELADPVQRFLNALQPGSYVRPHRHTQPQKWELFVLLAGAAVVLLFDDDARVTQRCELRAGGPLRGVEIPPGAWHTLAALEADTVLFEIKPGPYTPLADKDFASWAPPEQSAGSAELERRFRHATPGERLA